jgi:hypothetical protein
LDEILGLGVVRQLPGSGACFGISGRSRNARQPSDRSVGAARLSRPLHLIHGGASVYYSARFGVEVTPVGDGPWSSAHSSGDASPLLCSNDGELHAGLTRDAASRSEGPTAVRGAHALSDRRGRAWLRTGTRCRGAPSPAAAARDLPHRRTHVAQIHQGRHD